MPDLAAALTDYAALSLFPRVAGTVSLLAAGCWLLAVVGEG